MKVEKSTKSQKKEARRKFRIGLLMTEQEIGKIHADDKMLRERYGITRNDVVRHLLTESLSDGRILFLMGFTPKKKQIK